MTTKGPAEPFKKLLPQSWVGWFVAIVLGVVTVTHPAEAWHATSTTIWGAGRWVGYQAFADCGTPPPYAWMSPKRCPTDPAATSGDQAPAVGTAVPASGGSRGLGGQASVDRVVTEATHLHRLVDGVLADDGAKPTQRTRETKQ